MKVIKIYSDTCGPCKILEKNLIKSGINYDSININSEEGELMVTRYDIRSIPTLVLIDDDGNMIDKHSGVLTPEGIKYFVDETYKSNN